MKIFHLAAMALLLFAVWAGAKPPPPAPRLMPGDVKGETRHSRWLAPFAHASSWSVGGQWLGSVRWFTPDGKLRRELSGPHVHWNNGYVTDQDAEGNWIIVSLAGDSEFVLPNKKDGGLAGTANGSAFLHSYRPVEDVVAGDLYVRSKLVATLGPFWSYKAERLRFGNDGSLFLMAATDKEKKGRQLVSFRPDGKLAVQVECDASVSDAVDVAPDGRGILVRDSGDERGRFSFWNARGKVASLKMAGGDPTCLAWTPGTACALMRTGAGAEYRFHVVDWGAGKELWTIRDPCPKPSITRLLRVAATEDYFLLGGAERMDLGGPATVRCISAIDAKTGKTVARWHPSPLCDGRDDLDFFQTGNRVYVITDAEFSEINVDDIAAKKRGWH